MEDLKERGNQEFKLGHFQKAVNYYTQAIDQALDQDQLNIKNFTEQTPELISLQNHLKSNDCVQKCLNNRAQCYLKLENHEEAAIDACRGMVS